MRTTGCGAGVHSLTCQLQVQLMMQWTALNKQLLYTITDTNDQTPVYQAAVLMTQSL